MEWKRIICGFLLVTTRREAPSFLGVRCKTQNPSLRATPVEHQRLLRDTRRRVAGRVRGAESHIDLARYIAWRIPAISAVVLYPLGNGHPRAVRATGVLQVDRFRFEVFVAGTPRDDDSARVSAGAGA